MLKGWKTILFNVITGIILILESQGVTHWGIAPGVVEIILVLGNLILRTFFTDTSVGKKV